MKVVQQEVATILRKAKFPKLNLTLNEYKEPVIIRNNKDEIIPLTYKGNATLIMNTTNYDKK